MEYLHTLNIVHRDVKPENILYTSEGASSIKLIDFGYAGVWSADKPLTGLCGTPDYVAPEVLTWYDDDEHGTPYGHASDLWSLGVLLYVILSGCSPFSADEVHRRGNSPTHSSRPACSLLDPRACVSLARYRRRRRSSRSCATPSTSSTRPSGSTSLPTRSISSPSC